MRYFNVKGCRLLATKLDTVFMEGRKLFANISRFQRKVSITGKHRDSGFNKRQKERKYEPSFTHDRRDYGVVNGRSFLEATMNMDKGNNIATSYVGPRKHLSFKAGEESIRNYEKLFIGIIKDPGNLCNMKKVFHEEGIFSIRVTSLGVNLFLLEDLLEGETTTFVEEHREWWSSWFKEIRKWEPNDVDKERITWIKCSGIPCHFWNTICLETISSTSGTFINCDINTFTKLNMEVARIRIRPSCMAVINETIPMEISGLSFKIYVTEYLGTPWVPLSKRKPVDEEDLPSAFFSKDLSDESDDNDGSEGPEDTTDRVATINEMETVDAPNVEKSPHEVHRSEKDQSEAGCRRHSGAISAKEHYVLLGEFVPTKVTTMVQQHNINYKIGELDDSSFKGETCGGTCQAQLSPTKIIFGG